MTALKPWRLAVLAALLVCAAPLHAGGPVKLLGGIAGIVRDASGVPQMGASVILYNQSERPVRRALTNQNGEFNFASLVPGVYSIRVVLASFLPALKRNIVVQPGMQSLLSVNLASVFSSIELVGLAPGQGGLMSEEWKWVLRASTATRPVLRLLPDISPAGMRGRAALFSRTRGMVRVIGGDDGQVSTLGFEPDLGTSFALATTVLGVHQLQFSGNLAYSPETGSPAAAFRTSFRRELPSGGPQVGLTMRQLYLPVRVAAGQAWLEGRDGAAPPLRTVSATVYDRSRPTESLVLEYGASLDSVTFLDRLNYLSPFARVGLNGGKAGSFAFAYASGTPPAELLSSPQEPRAEFEQDLAALGVFPRISVAAGRARVQRVESYEVGYQFRSGSRAFSAAAYRESISNAAFTLVAPAGVPANSELVPDLFSRSWVMNAGTLRRAGYVAALTQELGEHLDVTVAYAGGGVLTTETLELTDGGLQDLRSGLRVKRRHSVTVRVAGAAPPSGTRFVASYQWASLHSALPPHVYLTQRVREGLGVNLSLRQPIPAFGPLPGKLEASAELRNLLAQGYVPLNLSGRRVYLLHTPRSVRGGLSFIF